MTPGVMPKYENTPLPQLTSPPRAVWSSGGADDHLLAGLHKKLVASPCGKVSGQCGKQVMLTRTTTPKYYQTRLCKTFIPTLATSLVLEAAIGVESVLRGADFEAAQSSDKSCDKGNRRSKWDGVK